MKGNSGIMKCLIPSFVADFVEVTGWIDDIGTEYINDKKFDQGIPISLFKTGSHPLPQIIPSFCNSISLIKFNFFKPSYSFSKVKLIMNMSYVEIRL